MQRFQNILYVSKPGSISNGALDRVVALANANQARLNVIELVEEAGSLKSPATISTRCRESTALKNERGLDGHVAFWRDDAVQITTKLINGDSFQAIVQEVLRDRYDLVVKTAESFRWLDRILGRDDMYLLRHCPCAVWIIKQQETKSFKKIIAAVDVSPDYAPDELQTKRALNNQILEISISLALSEPAELHVAHACSIIGDGFMGGAARTPQDELIAHVEEVRGQHQQNLTALMDNTSRRSSGSAIEYLEPQTHLLKGSPSRAIPRFASEIDSDLVVIGTMARSGISGLFIGNTVESVLSQLNCSVLTIKPSGFVSPITLGD